MRKNATHKLAIDIAKQAHEANYQSYNWMVISMLMYVGENEDLTLKDYLKELKNQISGTSQIIKLQNKKCFRSDI
jgi:hypothetical protein